MSENYLGDIQEYQFRSFSKKPINTKEDDVDEYQFSEFSRDSKMDTSKHDQLIRLERESAGVSNFKISPIVKEHRGLNKQEEEDKERRINDEVNKRLVKLQEDAYKKAFQQGIEEGKNEIIEQEKLVVQEHITELANMVENVIANYSSIVKKQKQELYALVKTVSKWIILRELKDDGKYVERLLEKLINELQMKANLIIQVSPKVYENMPVVLDVVQEKIGTLHNVRIEIDHELKNDQDIVISSDNGIINGSLEKQFEAIDRIFQTVGVDE